MKEIGSDGEAREKLSSWGWFDLLISVLFLECQNARGEFYGLGTRPYRPQVLCSVSKFKWSKVSSSRKTGNVCSYSYVAYKNDYLLEGERSMLATYM